MAADPKFTAPFPPASTTPVTLPEPSRSSSSSSLLSPLTNLIERIDHARDRLALPEPGKFEDLGREVKCKQNPLSSRVSRVIAL